uniref:uncharacterized protein LOC117602290 isoform X1 n=1 Tax=Osmia lignaria TaxID=473952 RepID=UPI001478ED8F|nr:uncharacterized protein LOC117602290 isoform X1 [Osmia lignaria]XP_034175997.1 uncharacterized protein LOC117602290 isoform X3 [Osmia lignaria]
MPEYGGEHGLRLPKMAPGLRSALSSPPRFAAWRSAPVFSRMSVINDEIPLFEFYRYLLSKTVAYSQRRMVQRKGDCRRRRMMGMYQGRRESSKAEESDGFRGEELKIEDQRRREKWLGCCSGEEYALNGRSRRQKEEKCRNMEENTVFDCLKWPPVCAPL